MWVSQTYIITGKVSRQQELVRFDDKSVPAGISLDTSNQIPMQWQADAGQSWTLNMMTNSILNVTVKSPVMTKIHAPLKNNIVPIKTWGLEVGFWFAVFSWWVWGLWCGAFWVWRGQGYLYRHRKITLEIKNGVSQTPETPWLTLCNQFNYLFLKIFWSFILVLW